MFSNLFNFQKQKGDQDPGNNSNHGGKESKLSGLADAVKGKKNKNKKQQQQEQKQQQQIQPEPQESNVSNATISSNFRYFFE